MLQSIRDRASGWIVWGIILLLILALSLWGVENFVGSGRADAPVAKVNGEKIMMSELNRAYERILEEQQNVLGENLVLTPEVEQELQEFALNELINRSLLLQAAKRANYYVSQEQITQTIQSFPALQIDGTFSPLRLNQLLLRLGLTLEDFYQEIEATLLADQIQTTFVNTAFSTEFDDKAISSLISQTRDIETATISIENYIDESQISEQIIEEYYTNNAHLFTQPEMITIQYLTLSRNDFEQGIAITDQQIQTYYQQNIAQYTIPARWEIAHILIQADKYSDDIEEQRNLIDDIYQQLQEGADFSDLAKAYSEDIATASTGGELGWVTQDSLDASYIRAIETLTSVGEFSAPFQNDYGLNIVKLLDIEPEQRTELAELYDDIKIALHAQEADTQFNIVYDQLFDLVYDFPDSLSTAADSLNLEITTTDFFSREGGNDRITQNPRVIATAFSEDVLQDGFNSNPINLNDDTILVLRLSEYKPISIIPLEEVQEDIRQQVVMEQAEKHLIEQVNQWKETLDVAVSLANFAAQNTLAYNNYNNISRYEADIPQEILNKAFQMLLNEQNSVLDGTRLASGDYAIIKLNGVHENASELLAAEHAFLSADIARNSGNLAFYLYTQSLRDNAKIVIY